MENAESHHQAVVVAGTLGDRVTELLLQAIKSGEFAADARLPSEAALSKRFSVSRTVIREAVARLKAEGVVVTHQGKGTVIVGSGQPVRFQIHVDIDGSVQAVLRVMELRGGLEAEAAALAAERRTALQNAEIQRALKAIDEAVAAGRDGVDEDVAFHNAIADATGNPLYMSLLGFLRQFLREAVTLGRMSEPRFGDIAALLEDEHRTVAEAIARQDVEAARHAARAHIGNVAARIRGAGVNFWNGAPREAAERLAKSEEQVLKRSRDETRQP